jgi:hypothetical protein
MTDTFTQHRSWLFALAYRMLGTATDAEDVLQDAHLRFSEHNDQVRHPKRWLVESRTFWGEACSTGFSPSQKHSGPSSFGSETRWPTWTRHSLGP